MLDARPVQEFLDEIADLPDFCGISPVDLNTRGHFDNTPLHIAAIRGDVAVITTLLEEGAFIDARGEHGYTPLHEVVEQGHLDAARVLLAQGASTKIVNDEGKTPLNLAELSGLREIAKLFV